MQFQTLIVDAESNNIRLDNFLSNKLKISRNQIQKLISTNNIRVNKEIAKKTGIKLKENDEISYRIPKVSVKEEAEEIDLDIIFENNDFIVINKDPGIVVHPNSSGHKEGTLVNAVLGHTNKLSTLGDGTRPGIIHRLDKDTSGVIIIAKNNNTHERFAKLFHDRKVEKLYITLVKGIPKTEKGIIEAGIKRDSKSRKRMSISARGKNAITRFKVIEKFSNYALLEVKIETGRTHQIRLHLASIGHPVIGDDTYGDKELNEEFSKKYGLERQFLHAKLLKIDSKSYSAPLKKDLKKVLDNLKTE